MSVAVVVTGSRFWENTSAVVDELDDLWFENRGDLVVIEGGAVGADAIAGSWAREMAHVTRNGSRPVIYEPMPALWWALGTSAGPERNRRMTQRLIEYRDDGFATLVLAYPTDGSRGTRNMMNLAVKAGIEVRNHGAP